MSKSGKYLLTAMLTIMLVVAPMRTAMALPMLIGDQCDSMVNHGSELQQPGHALSEPDNGHSSQANDQGCCDETVHTCATDCQVCTSIPYVATATSPATTPRQHFLNPGLKASAVPLDDTAPLLRPPVTLHS